MKRVLYAVVILWTIGVGVYLMGMGRIHSVSISTAFSDSVDGEEWCELDTYIEGYGKFGVCYLTQEEKEKLVKNVAGALGISSPCVITTIHEKKAAGDMETEGRGVDVTTTILSKESINGSVTIKAITKSVCGDNPFEDNEPEDMSVEQKVTTENFQYVYVNITVYNDIDSAVAYRELVEGVFDAMGIKGNVNMNLVGSLEGALNNTEKNELADNLLKKLDADVVAENRDENIFTIYAYSKGAGSYITIGGNKININIAVGYDEERDRTKVYLASPINSLDY